MTAHRLGWRSALRGLPVVGFPLPIALLKRRLEGSAPCPMNLGTAGRTEQPSFWLL